MATLLDTFLPKERVVNPDTKVREYSVAVLSLIKTQTPKRVAVDYTYKYKYIR